MQAAESSIDTAPLLEEENVTFFVRDVTGEESLVG